MDEVVVVAAVRTPVGKFQGMFAPLSAVQLGAAAVREAVRRAGIDPALVDECIMGNVLPLVWGRIRRGRRLCSADWRTVWRR
jgi:acetyl-CoA C-acetyltransferase